MTNSYGTILNSYKQQNKDRRHKWLQERDLLPKKKKKKKKKRQYPKMTTKRLRDISARILKERGLSVNK